MRSSRPGRLIALAIGVLTCGAIFAAAAAGSAPSHAVRSLHGRFVLQGTKPSWTVGAPQRAAVAPTKQVEAKVWLAPRHEARLTALAHRVSNPAGSQYRHFLTRAQYDARFAPTARQVSAVRRWLTHAGLRIVASGPDGHYLAVSGPAAAINVAFGTKLGTYAVKGKRVQAPTRDLSIPRSVAGRVLAVTGLSKLGHMVKPEDLGAPDAYVNGTPCSSYYGQFNASDQPKFHGKTLPYAPCGYVPSQLRGTYGEDGSTSDLGKGATVAITDAFDASVLEQDANTYSQRHGDKKFAPHQFQDRSFPEGASSDPDPIDSCGGNGWYGEQTLDIEAAHGMAPAANVLYYGAASCYDDDLLASLSKVVHDNDASIVTNSWGDPTFIVDPTIGCNPCSTIDADLVNAYESVFKQGAVQGIGFYFSSGDDGDEYDAYGYAHPDYPTGDPWVTSVGGTSLAVDRHDRRDFETGWGTSSWGKSGNSWVQQVPFLYGSGGGYSQVFAEPWYQRGVVRHDPTGGRAVPDISTVGDPTTGMLVGETQSFSLPSRYGPAGVHYGEYRIGGTSLSSPLMAGLQAVTEGRSRIGFANPLIYSLFGRGVYYDVTPQGDLGNIRVNLNNSQNTDDGVTYSLRTFDQDSSLTTGRGWDDVTGVGAPTNRYIDAAGAHDGHGH